MQRRRIQNKKPPDIPGGFALLSNVNRQIQGRLVLLEL